MPDEAPGEVTRLLHAIQAGDRDAQDRLVRLVYNEFRQRAAGLMQGERADHTMQPSDLVHETFGRLLEEEALQKAPNRRYLFGAAAQAMRRILVEHARQRKAAKRAGNRQRVPLDAVLEQYEQHNGDVLALHEALERLAAELPRASEVIELRFFGGLTLQEVAEHLDVCVATVQTHFKIGRAWLHRHLGGSR